MGKQVKLVSLLASLLLGSGIASAGDWANQGGDAGMTKYSPDNIAANSLEQVYKKRFYSQWQDWVGDNWHATYMTANNVMIRNGVAVVQSSDTPRGSIWAPLNTTVFDWKTGATSFVTPMRQVNSTEPDYNKMNHNMWFHSGENSAEIDSHHYTFPAVFGSDNRVYMRRGGDQRAMGALNLATRTWTYTAADTPVPSSWAGDAAAFINIYKDRLLYHPGDTRDGWNYASQDISATAWTNGTPGQSAVWIPNAAPRLTNNSYYDGIRAAGDFPKAAKDVAVVGAWYYDYTANVQKTYVTASNVYSGQQLWTKNYDTANVGSTGFYATSTDYWQFVATEGGHYAMFNRPSGGPAVVRVLDLLTGNEKWNKSLSSDASPLMSYHDNYLYVVARGEQMKVNADTGEVAWKVTNSFTGDTPRAMSDPVYRTMVLTDDTLWFVNNLGIGADHLIGMRTSDGSIFQDINIQSLVGANEQALAVRDLVAADGRLGVFLDIKDLNDPYLQPADPLNPDSPNNPYSKGQKYQDLFVFQAAVPEPGSIGLLSLGGLALLARRRH